MRTAFLMSSSASVWTPGDQVPAMRKFNRVLLALSAPFLFAACSDDTAGTMDPNLCDTSAPVRLISAPEGWQPNDHETNFTSRVIDDRLLYSFLTATPTGTFGDVLLRDLCGGEPELVLSADSELSAGPVLEHPSAGKVLYGWGAPTMYVVDRLDEPGADVPKPVAGLTLASEGDAVWSIESWEHGPLFVHFSVGTTPTANAAGIGASTREILTLGPTPDAPAVLLGKDIVHTFHHGEQIGVHTDDGAAFLYDQVTGIKTPLVDNARWVSMVALGERSLLLVQDMGDDLAEPVRLVDLETGESRQVTVNDFVQGSFGRDPEHANAGTWTAVNGGDSGFIALYGPDGKMMEGYDVATLEPVEIPDNLGRIVINGTPWMPLILPDPTDTVLAAWDPATGEVHEWYRGPQPEFNPYLLAWRDGKLEYTTKISDGVYRVSQIDATTGETTVVLPRRGASWKELADGRIITGFPIDRQNFDVVLIDPETATETTLVAGTHKWEYNEAHRLVLYTDFAGSQPGLWAAAIPVR